MLLSDLVFSLGTWAKSMSTFFLGMWLGLLLGILRDSLEIYPRILIGISSLCRNSVVGERGLLLASGILMMVIKSSNRLQPWAGR